MWGWCVTSFILQMMKLRPRRSDLAKSQSWEVGNSEFERWCLALHFFSPCGCLCQLDMANCLLPACSPTHCTLSSLLIVLLVPGNPTTSACLTCLDPRGWPGCFMRSSLQSPCIQRSDTGTWLFLLTFLHKAGAARWHSFAFSLHGSEPGPLVHSIGSQAISFLLLSYIWIWGKETPFFGPWASAVLSSLGRRALYQYFGHKPS